MSEGGDRGVTITGIKLSAFRIHSAYDLVFHMCIRDARYESSNLIQTDILIKTTGRLIKQVLSFSWVVTFTDEEEGHFADRTYISYLELH